MSIDTYSHIVARVTESLEQSEEHLDSALNLAVTSVELLRKANEGNLSRIDHGALLSVEVLFGVAMNREAWLLHRAGDHQGAHRALARSRKFLDAIQMVLREA
jgi:hypothetical protein